jgi:hypothetical protein
MAVCFIGGGVPGEKQQPATSHCQTSHTFTFSVHLATEWKQQPVTSHWQTSYTFTFRVHLATEWKQNHSFSSEQAIIANVNPPLASS